VNELKAIAKAHLSKIKEYEDTGGVLDRQTETVSISVWLVRTRSPSYVLPIIQLLDARVQKAREKSMP
jgi:hypothetical protein